MIMMCTAISSVDEMSRTAEVTLLLVCLSNSKSMGTRIKRESLAPDKLVDGLHRFPTTHKINPNCSVTAAMQNILR